MDSLIFSCSDGSLTESLAAFAERHRFETADRMLVPGGPLVLTRPGMERRVALSCVRQLVEDHNVRRIGLIVHEGCSAYERALGGFGFDQRELLERDLRRVRTLLENELPGTDISCWFIPHTDSGEGPVLGEAKRVE